jgi:hypothetical protein
LVFPLPEISGKHKELTLFIGNTPKKSYDILAGMHRKTGSPAPKKIPGQ